MAKKKSWFARVKGLFFAAKDEHKDQLKKKKKKRGLFGWMRTTKKPPSLAAPSLSRDRTEIIARKQVAHQDLLVADPAASEAAMACSTTAARYPGLSLPRSSSSTRQCEDHLAAKILLHRAQLVRHVEHLAAIKIQTAFRGYLARKALRALKGLVRLQAMIRGRAVRRQAVATLKSLQSIVNIQSQVCATRYQKASESKQSEDPRYVKMKIGQSIQRRRDHTLLMKDEENAILLSKTEAMMQRNRLKAYSFNHRHSADVEDGKMLGRLRRWLEEYEEYEVPMKEEIKKVDSIAGKQLMRLRSAQHHQASEIVMAPRKSFEGKKHRAASQSVDKIDAKPAYMAATESARARVRSMSSARLVRPMQLESYSDGDSPYKSKISLMSSMKSERSCIGGALVASGSYLRHRSCTGRRGIGGSMRLNRNVTDSGPENGRWLLDWN